MQGIFISYRRLDSQSAAGRLADHLKENMHGVPLFRDVETIEPGVDFVEAIGHALQSCGILLAVIGPRWVSLQDAAGRRRLDDPNDYTRLEISTALQRNDVRVIPVLVEGAQMPGSDDLPDDLKPLARRNAIELTDKRWEYDVSQLVDTLGKALHVPLAPKPPRPEPKPPQPSPEKSSSRSWTKWAWGIGALIVIIAAYNANEDSYDPTGRVPGGDTGQRPPVAEVILSGNWQDAEGGSYRLVQQGVQVAFQGRSPHGPVAGRGMLQGNQLTLDYTLNGYPYQAVLLASPDGLNLLGQYRGANTGDSGPVHLQRAR
ncbi:MAG: toll/interleukin-1 receptor domain-containing protein [Propionivibrio sp.]|uniref:Toll/interleukin-1 receptor domain-containing protein n=1 Tax=Candidatus Propionivibrio dominans TaxID=2954373 RepID=A0A9D7ICV9_9RHOO|nr:toll/interleukin-1 receptor domain-containing protein [Candidatus Propionivibrio dominans]